MEEELVGSSISLGVSVERRFRLFIGFLFQGLGVFLSIDNKNYVEQHT